MLAAAALVAVPYTAVPRTAAVATADQAAATAPARPHTLPQGPTALESTVAAQTAQDGQAIAPELDPGPPSNAPEGNPEGQRHADYLVWLAGSPDARAEVKAFNDYLTAVGVAGVIPTWELLRTASMWRDCSGPRFEVAPRSDWQHIAAALQYVKTQVVPAIGRVHAVSGYRNQKLNRCANGAPASAHRHFYALDLVPAKAIGRGGLIRSMCAAHSARGRDYDVGLGFYSGTRFHVDSKGFRRWGPDGSGATSPCVTEV